MLLRETLTIFVPAQMQRAQPDRSLPRQLQNIAPQCRKHSVFEVGEQEREQYPLPRPDRTDGSAYYPSILPPVQNDTIILLT